MMIRYLILSILLISLLPACQKQEIAQVELFDFSTVPFKKLSDYHFYEGDLKNLEPNPTLLPYDLTTGLFSNYAEKQRLIYFPVGSEAAYINNEQETIDFPDGTIIIKTFFYYNDLRDESKGKRVLETRLLIRKAGVWEAADYIWNEEQTEAYHEIAGKQVPVEWIHFDGSKRSTLYAIPNDNECKGCHELGDEMVLIGPKARMLNKDYTYKRKPENQLQKWEALGLLSNLPPIDQIPKTALFEDSNASLELKARTYLDINCAHCHNSNGPANNTGMFLDFEQTDSLTLGTCKPPVAAGGGTGGLSYALVPGDPENSIMIYRLNSLELDVSMPELGRSVIHEEGLQLLTDWVDSLAGDCE